MDFLAEIASRNSGREDFATPLFKGDGSHTTNSTGRPNIYINVSGNPDLSF